MSKCPNCNVEVMDAQVAMHFSAIGPSQDWKEFPVLAGTCPECGKMELHAAMPQSLKEWLDSQKSATKAASR
jgi:hypothetical protein